MTSCCISTYSSNDTYHRHQTIKTFSTSIHDFVKDLLTTYPELEENLDENLIAARDQSLTNEMIVSIRSFCATKFPERFFDILYQNEDMFSNEDVDLELLPSIDFKILWKSEISDNTK